VNVKHYVSKLEKLKELDLTAVVKQPYSELTTLTVSVSNCPVIKSHVYLLLLPQSIPDPSSRNSYEK